MLLGLTQRVRDSIISLDDAEQQVLAFVQLYTQPGQALLAGNTVHADLQFIKRYMPKLAAHLHYRIVDVSTVKELAYRWYPREHNRAPRKKLEHRALADIRESINELKYLRGAIFKSPQTNASKDCDGNRQPPRK
eukprot:jgi/Chlat1/340/Chrsp1S03078